MSYRSGCEQSRDVHFVGVLLLLREQPEQLGGCLVLGGQEGGVAHQVLQELNRDVLQPNVTLKILKASSLAIQDKTHCFIA